MRTILSVLIVVLAASTARADENVAGTFDVKFEEIGNCNPPPVTLTHGKVVIKVEKNTLSFNTELIPVLTGVPPKNGKINAKTNKIVGTTVVGLSARYSVSGRVEGGMLQLVLTAEYVKQDQHNTAYCTQAWNVNGARSADEAPKDKK